MNVSGLERLVLATRNAGKLAEMQALLAGYPIALVSAAALPGAPDPDEPFATLEENALQKARMLSDFSGAAALADDTGLEVAALGGRPGVHSARFAGPAADAAANRRRLLAELEGRPDRRARFRTVVALALPGGAAHTFEGVCEGAIAPTERGAAGFGYDALFVPEGAGRTFAEMDADEKNRISHRGKALRQFAAWLEARGGRRPA